MKRLLKLPLIMCLSAFPPAASVAQEGDKAMSGMSILGNNDAPKALVIVSVPPRASTRFLAASNPTPRPEKPVTLALVENPG